MFIYLVASATLAQPLVQQSGPTTSAENTVATHQVLAVEESSNNLSTIREGYWGIENLRLVSDACQLNTFQDVQEFVPEAIKVSKSQEGSFYLDFNTPCEVKDGRFECATQNFIEPALLGTTTIQIRNIFSGQMVSPDSLRVEFTVAVDSCDGFGCWGISSLLDFPCSVVLTATAQH